MREREDDTRALSCARLPSPRTRALEPPELAVIVPTYNERTNLRALLRRLCTALEGVAFEIVVVDDDSPDGTAGLVRELAAQDPRLRCLVRIGRRGLASACIEGMLATSAPYLAVIDADLQHDERLLVQMLDLLRSGRADLVIASRYLEGAAVFDWAGERRLLSRVGTALARVSPRLRPLSDPLSGFFAITRTAFESTVRRLSGIGFKLLLDILLSAPTPLRTVELPYRFSPRRSGASKLDARVAVEFVLLIVDKLLGGWIPPRFVLFAAVGGLGVLVHLATLFALREVVALAFLEAHALATVAAMTFNFALNNALTYRDRRLRGLAWLRGWLSFSLICSLGAFANVGIAAVLFAREASWLAAALAGILVGAVWNYAVTSVYTWGDRTSR